jgi:lipid II:glycine glycyltransferase (peptidoglycan interpeptide bridge formation enzyme)
LDLLELRAPEALPLDLFVSHRKVTVLLDLPSGDAEPLWKGLRAKVRSQVRRPMKEGVEVRFGVDQLGPFYEVFGRHMRDLGTPVQPKRFFERLSEAFGDQMWIGCAYLGGQPVAAGAGFRWAEKFELVWASALREFNRVAPNMLLYWRFFERCIDDGAHVFDFGRCTPGGGTHRFKAQWGGRDEQLWWYQHGPKSGGGTPSPDSGPFSLGPRVWRKLPVPVANLLGPRIVKFIP